MVKNLPAVQETKRHGIDPWAMKIPWRKAWQPTPVFLPGESHGQRSLEGYGPWGHKELETTERLSTHTWKCPFPASSVRFLSLRALVFHFLVFLLILVEHIL